MRKKPYNERLKELGLPTLQYRRLRADIIQVYKILTEVDNIASKPFFQLNDSSITRGHNFKLTKDRNRTSKRQAFFKPRIISLWNDLPSYVVNSNNINSFKNNLNKAWMNNPIKFYV